MTKLTHLDDAGHAHMVDVSQKPDTARIATAQGRIVMAPATLAMIVDGTAPKGDVLATARIAGIMAAKHTSDLIPLCHPLALSKVEVQINPVPPDSLHITATAKVTGPTGVEMEALCAVSVAALTIYDMVKAVDRSMTISDIQLTHKSGGASGVFDRAQS
jgi:cyclic pyranopterin phosphate synthase